MRSLIAPLAAAALLVTAAPAFAQVNECDPPPEDGFCGGATLPPIPPRGPEEPEPSDPDESEEETYVWYSAELRGSVDDPDSCWSLSTEVHTTPPPPGRTYDDAIQDMIDYGTNGVAWDLCPDTGEDLAGSAAREFWSRATLPVPVGSIEPDNTMIVGLTAYLVIDDQPRGVWPPPAVPTPLGALGLDIRHQGYDIAWGDGATTSSDSPGVPYPGGPGEITHVYDTSGTYDLTVTSHWSAAVRLGSLSIDLGDRTVTETFTLTVDQMQSVRDR